MASIKVRETLEIQAEIESARANKVSSAPRERTNRLSGNEGYTRPKNVATLPSFSASSSSLSSDGGTFDSPNDADIQPILEVANQIIAVPCSCRLIFSLKLVEGNELDQISTWNLVEHVNAILGLVDKSL